MRLNNIIDFIKNYGDKTFDELPFNKIDNLIFSAISYYDYSKLLDNGKSDIIENLFKKINVIKKNDKELIEEMKKAIRYKDLKIYNFMEIKTYETQFAAITIDINEYLTVISYRGTDSSLSGWKEDLELSYKFPVQAQIMAVEYCNKLANNGKKIILVGHSKGGNLALIAGMYSNINSQILEIYSNDGPGLLIEQLLSKKFRNIYNRYLKIIPKNSVIGLLLYNYNNEIVVDSNTPGIESHDLFNWIVIDKELKESKLVKQSIILNNDLNNWLSSYNKYDKKIFITELVKVLEKNNIDELTQIHNLTKKQLFEIVDDALELNSKTKIMLKEFFTIVNKYVLLEIKDSILDRLVDNNL